MQNIEMPQTKEIVNKDEIINFNGHEYICLIDGLELPKVMTRQLFLDLELQNKIRTKSI